VFALDVWMPIFSPTAQRQLGIRKHPETWDQTLLFQREAVMTQLVSCSMM
jgi:hypothetical protein